MSAKPQIGMVRTLDDCIRALNLLRAYFNTPDTAATVTGGRFLTDSQIAALSSNTSSNTTITIGETLADVGGTGKQAKIQVRFMGLNPDGTDLWQFEVVSI